MRYLMLIIISLLLFFSTKHEKNQKRYIILSAVLLIIYSAFRAYIGGNVVVGNDYYSYQKWFNNIHNINIFNFNNFSFNILFYLIKTLTNSYTVFIFLSSLLFIYAAYRFSMEHTTKNDYAWAVFIFISFGIYELGMSAIRQWMAGSIFLLSLKYIKKHDFIKYALMILLASTFHNSALILIFVYPFINIKLSLKNKVLFTTVGTMLLSFAVRYKLDLFLISLIDSTYLIKYQEVSKELLSNYTVFIISSSCFLAIALFLKRYKQYSENWNFEICYLIMLISISFLATKSALCGRFLQYFFPALMLVIPGIINMFDGKFKKFLSVCAVIVLSLIFIM